MAKLLERFTAEFKLLCERKAVIRVELTPLEAWCLFAQAQLASRHPENVGPSREVGEAAARKIQELVATTPALKEVAEMGWNPAFDGVEDEILNRL